MGNMHRLGSSLSQYLRFVVLLREPVDRAISSYWFKQGFGPRKTDKPPVVGGSREHMLQMFRQEMEWRIEFEHCVGVDRLRLDGGARVQQWYGQVSACHRDFDPVK